LKDHVAATCGNHSAFEQQQIEGILFFRTDRPAWGDDWTDWLKAALPDACDEVISVNAGQPPGEGQESETMLLDATIEERGNGLPDVGDYVPGDDGELYRVVSMSSRIETGRCPGAGDWVNAKVELADWDDCDEDDLHPSQCILDDDGGDEDMPCG
jgi:hypothetical protein